MSVVAAGARIGWDDLPERVRAHVEAVLDDRVVEARSQVGGFSPGTADRVRTAGGRRAFVKAVSAGLNDLSVHLHRREAAVTAALPPTAPAPRLLSAYDDGEWVALVLDDVEGRHPRTPWQEHELAAVAAALDDLARALTPAPALAVPATGEALAEDLAGWSRVAADPPADLDPWTAARLSPLQSAAERGLAALAGDTLVHGDIRADNLLIGPDGSVTIVDWPWASRGAPWFDGLCLLVNVRLFGGHDVDAMLARLASAHDADPDDLVAVLVALAGFFCDAARRPPPPGLPTVRAFQRAQADAVLDWLRERHAL